MESVSRLRRSDQIIGVSAILFFIFLFFFKWFGISSSASNGGFNFSASANGWHTFTNSRWLWLLTIIVALVAVALDAGWIKAESPVSLGAVVAVLGGLSTLFILYRILHHPSASASSSIAGVHITSSVGIKIGIWLGFFAAIGVTYGGYLNMQEEGTSFSDVRDQAGGAVSGLSGPSGGGGAPAAAPTPPPAAAPVAEPAPPAAEQTPPTPPPAPAAAPPIPPPAASEPQGGAPPTQ